MTTAAFIMVFIVPPIAVFLVGWWAVRRQEVELAVAAGSVLGGAETDAKARAPETGSLARQARRGAPGGKKTTSRDERLVDVLFDAAMSTSEVHDFASAPNVLLALERATASELEELDQRLREAYLQDYALYETSLQDPALHRRVGERLDLLSRWRQAIDRSLAGRPSSRPSSSEGQQRSGTFP